MTKKRTFSPEFRLEAAHRPGIHAEGGVRGHGGWQIHYGVLGTLVSLEQAGGASKGGALTPEQREIQDLKRKLRRVEEEKEILKKATALLMSDFLSSSR